MLNVIKKQILISRAKAMTELCLMCENYLTKCTREQIQMKQNETYDGFKVTIESCPMYKRMELQHKEETSG